MTSASALADSPTERLRAVQSRNGGPPPRPSAKLPLAALAAAFLLGVAVARFLDWRSHAHPRD